LKGEADGKYRKEDSLKWSVSEWNWFQIISNGRPLVGAALKFMDVPSPELVCQPANTLSLTNTVQVEFETTPSPMPQPFQWALS